MPKTFLFTITRPVFNSLCEINYTRNILQTIYGLHV